MAIIRTIVVNLRKSSFTKYIGRGSKFGNPYALGRDGGREVVIAKHKKDFYENPELQEAVWKELKGELLGCFCKPQACHGDTYVEYIENRMRIEYFKANRGYSHIDLEEKSDDPKKD